LHIFIDESGSFTGYHDQSLSLVGALAIPDGKLGFISRKYAKIRSRLTENGEVKGRLLNEIQINDVVTMLARNEVLFEVTVIDLGFHKESEIAKRRQEHADYMLSRLDRFRGPDRGDVEKASHQILVTSLPLYIQAMVTFDVLHNVINNIPLYFSQRQPHELGKFVWVVDGKDPRKVTNWEMWLSLYARGALATMSKRRPGMVLEGADYSYFDRFSGYTTEPSGEVVEATDLQLLLADLRFSPAAEPGLELVDILVNATRRALIGSLSRAGWRQIPRLMAHRKESYIHFIMLAEGADQIRHPHYAPIVTRGFSTGGKSMLAPRFLRQVASEEIC
jgi:hypothetical protein